MGVVSAGPQATEQPGGGTEALPTFLVIGAQKSATTSLIHYLGAHPEVFALPDEVHFFDRNFDRGVEWYRGRFAGAAAARAIGESTPEYMYFDDVPGRIFSVVPAARLVAILRDPVDRAYSHYWHNRTRGHEPLPFRQAVEAEAHRLAGADREVRSRYSYLERGRYLVQLRRVCDHFPRRSLHVLLVDDLRRDRAAAVQRVYRFLGVDDRFVPPEIGRESNRFVRYRSQRLRRPIRRLPLPLRRVAARLNVSYREYPPLPPDVRVEVRKRFAEDNEALASWLGRDLSAWDG